MHLPEGVDPALEAMALLRYAGDQALLTGDSPEATTAIRERIVDPLAQAIAEYRDEPNQETEIRLMVVYSSLRRITGDVSGRSILDSRKAAGDFNRIIGTTVVLALLGVVTIALLEGASDPKKYGFVTSALAIATVAAWGGFGSCLYLLKRLYDVVRALQFSLDEFSGAYNRIALGAAVAVTFYLLFESTETRVVVADTGRVTETETEIGFNGSWAAYAILIGLSVKVFYGVLESLVETISERFRLSLSDRLKGSGPADGAVGAVAPAQSPPRAPSDHRVRELQSRLIGYGRLSPPATGILDSQTIAAASQLLNLAPPAKESDFDAETVLALLDEYEARVRSTAHAVAPTDDEMVVAEFLRDKFEFEPSADRRQLPAELGRYLSSPPEEVEELFGTLSLSEVAEAIRKNELG